MQRLRIAAVAALICVLTALPASAARDDFYLNLLHRGMAHVDAGQYDTATRELHIAAFGLVDAIPQFETAQIYLTIAADRLKNEADARRAAQRVIAAERIERRYGSLSVPATTRRSFETIATRLLTNDQYAFLKSSPATAVAVATTPAPQPAAPAPQAVITPAPAPPPVVTAAPTPAPQVATVQPAPVVVQPQPQPINPAPAPTPAPVVVQPQPQVINPAPAPAPAPVIIQPQPVPETRPQVQPQRPVPTPAPAPAPRETTIVVPMPQTPAPVPRIQPAAPRPNPETQLTLAEDAIDRDDLLNAARIYDLLIGDPNLTHAQLLRLGEGAYRARDFRTAARALERAGFRPGDEPYRYYYAVALYETGDYAAAKRELKAALPYIEVTRDVARYRVKIENAQ